jgi:hypothetical protein
MDKTTGDNETALSPSVTNKNLETSESNHS